MVVLNSKALEIDYSEIIYTKIWQSCSGSKYLLGKFPPLDGGRFVFFLNQHEILIITWSQISV